jgi:hypothetical protein
MDTKFDVWSMGCILLEVLVYVVQGPEGVKELYEARNIGHGVTHYCYWNEVTKKHVINPGAVKIVGKLLGDFATDKFILDVWGVILSMLQVDPRKRSTSSKAFEALKMAIKLNDPSAVRTPSSHSLSTPVTGLGIQPLTTSEDKKPYISPTRQHTVVPKLSNTQINNDESTQSGGLCDSPVLTGGSEDAQEELQSIKSAPCKDYTEAQDSVTRLADHGTPKATTPSEHSHVSGPTSQHRLAEDPFKQYPDERRVIRKR